ncbi:MAG: hypothetical protein JNG84_12165, partial [Archangium sp.]|nr:hypothetical protein [Archangium sp.]
MQIIQNVFPTGTVLKLVGVINETFDKAAFVRLAGSGHLVVDFDGVTRVTSFGVREWMSALSAIGKRYIGYINTRPSVMAQFNSVAQFGAP